MYSNVQQFVYFYPNYTFEEFELLKFDYKFHWFPSLQNFFKFFKEAQRSSLILKIKLNSIQTTISKFNIPDICKFFSKSFPNPKHQSI